MPHDLDDIKESLAEIKTLIKDFKKDLKGLVEIQQRLIHERLGVTAPPPPKEYGEDTVVVSKAKGKTGLKMDIVNLDDNRIRVSGKTYDYMLAIKDSGSASFDKESKSWTLPLGSLNKLILNFEAIGLSRDVDFSVNVTGTIPAEESGFGSGF